MKSKVLVFSLFVAFLFGVACGGGGSRNDGSGGIIPTVHKLFAGNDAVTSARLNHSTVAKNFDWSLTPKAYAQIQSLLVDQSFSGMCDTLPSGVEFVIYNAGGASESPDCASRWSQSTDSGIPVVGNGLLQKLYASGRNGTSPRVGRVKVYVLRGTDSIFTGLTCTVGTDRRCIDNTHTFAVLDGDEVYITAENEAGQTINRLKAVVLKSS